MKGVRALGELSSGLDNTDRASADACIRVVKFDGPASSGFCVEHAARDPHGLIEFGNMLESGAGSAAQDSGKAARAGATSGEPIAALSDDLSAHGLMRTSFPPGIGRTTKNVPGRSRIANK